MGLFRRKPQVVDAAHLLQESQTAPTQPEPDAFDEGINDAVEGGGPGAFRLTVGDVFAIKGRGTVVTGRVESGSVAAGSTVSLVRDGQQIRQVRVTGVEMFRNRLDTAVAGQNVGLLLDQVSRGDVETGDILTA